MLLTCADFTEILTLKIIGICIGEHMISSAIWNKLARVNFSNTNKIARARRASAICGLWKIYKCSFIPNCTRKIMWLLINNIYEKISYIWDGWAEGTHTYHAIRERLRHPGRALALKARLDWMLGLFSLFALNWLFSALFKKKTALLLTNQNGEIFSFVLLDLKT